MFDTVTSFLPLNDAISKVSFLESVSEVIDQESGEVRLRGRFKNFESKVSSQGLTLFGSICKYHLGNNFEKLTRAKIKEAIERLCDETKLDFKEAKVFRLDIGTSLLVRETVQTYFHSLGEARYFVRQENGATGLLYANSKRSMQFYDKIREVKRKRELIPEVFQGRNVLRFELQFKKRLKEQLGEVSIKRLYDENFYTQILSLWEREYFAIQRVSKLKFKHEAMNQLDSKKLDALIYSQGLKQIGESEFLEMISQAQKQGGLNKMQAKRLRDKLKRLMNMPEIIEPNEAILELDAKIKRAVSSFR